MDEKELGVSERWLESRAPGFKELPVKDRRAIFDFAFLWSLFEAEIMDANARVDLITAKVDLWTADNTLGADLYDAELAYFRNRYFADGKLPYHYPYLNLRKSDHPDIVEAVIEGQIMILAIGCLLSLLSSGGCATTSSAVRNGPIRSKAVREFGSLFI